MARICLLPERGVIEVGGPEARAFLQGLITNNMDLVGPARAIYAALLTPQGKFLFDFFVVQLGENFLLECEAARLADLCKRLNFYKLRSRVTIRDASADFAVAAQLPENAEPPQPGAAHAQDGGVIFIDPRLAAMGARMILPPAALGAYPQTPVENYHRLRLALGLADGARDIAVEKYFLLEANFEELNGVDFKKGCYVGQELVSRMKHRGVVRKRILPVSVEGPCPPPGTPILAAGREVGVLHSSQDARALAFLRLAALAPGAPALMCGEARLSLALPAWLTLTFPEVVDEQD